MVGVELGVESDAGEDAELGAGVEAVDVGGGIGLGITGGLCLREGVGVGGAGLHVREDEVAGAVDDAGEAGDAVALKTLESGGDDGDATGDGSVEAELGVVFLGDAGEVRAAIGDELLVGGDDGFAGLEGAGEPGGDGIESADGFDEDVDVGVEDVVYIFGPLGGGGDRLLRLGLTLAGDVAVVDVG